MRNYKIESYVPEEIFLLGKDARFRRALFDGCFVLDLHNKIDVIASSLANAKIELSMADSASLLTLFESKEEPLMLPCPTGTLLIYPAWQRLEMSLAFLFKEDVETLEKAYQNAKRYAFSMIFDVVNEEEQTPQTELESRLCALQFYMSRLFGDKRETNVTAQILMIANLVGCHLHKTSVARVNVTLNEQEAQTLGAYLFCTFMTLRRYNGKILASAEDGENTSFFTHVSQKYGILIQQTIKDRVAKPTALDLPSKADIASFATHPLFHDYKIEETDGTLCLHIPLRQKALLSSVPTHNADKELTITLFLIS